MMRLYSLRSRDALVCTFHLKECEVFSTRTGFALPEMMGGPHLALRAHGLWGRSLMSFIDSRLLEDLAEKPRFFSHRLGEGSIGDNQGDPRQRKGGRVTSHAPAAPIHVCALIVDSRHLLAKCT